MLFAPKMSDNKRFKIVERTNVQSLCKKKDTGQKEKRDDWLSVQNSTSINGRINKTRSK